MKRQGQLDGVTQMDVQILEGITHGQDHPR